MAASNFKPCPRCTIMDCEISAAACPICIANEDVWHCAQCTYANSMENQECSICETPHLSKKRRGSTRGPKRKAEKETEKEEAEKEEAEKEAEKEARKGKKKCKVNPEEGYYFDPYNLDDFTDEILGPVDYYDPSLPRKKQIVELSLLVENNLFDGDNSWVTHLITRDGHCFFRAFCRAYNTHPDFVMDPPLTVHALRQALANDITLENWEKKLANYKSYHVGRLPRNFQGLQTYVQRGIHFATREDIAVIYEQFNVYPIIIHHNYLDKKFKNKFDYAYMKIRDVAIQCLSTFPLNYNQQLYVLLLWIQTDELEHYELICNEKYRLSDDEKKRLAPTLTPPNLYRGFRAIFTWDELPEQLKRKVIEDCLPFMAGACAAACDPAPAPAPCIVLEDA